MDTRSELKIDGLVCKEESGTYAGDGKKEPPVSWTDRYLEEGGSIAPIAILPGPSGARVRAAMAAAPALVNVCPGGGAEGGSAVLGEAEGEDGAARVMVRGSSRSMVTMSYWNMNSWLSSHARESSAVVGLSSSSLSPRYLLLLLMMLKASFSCSSNPIIILSFMDAGAAGAEEAAGLRAGAVLGWTRHGLSYASFPLASQEVIALQDSGCRGKPSKATPAAESREERKEPKVSEPSADDAACLTQPSRRAGGGTPPPLGAE